VDHDLIFAQKKKVRSKKFRLKKLNLPFSTIALASKRFHFFNLTFDF